MFGEEVKSSSQDLFSSNFAYQHSEYSQLLNVVCVDMLKLNNVISLYPELVLLLVFVLFVNCVY